MQMFPSQNDIKSYNKVLIIFKNPYNELEIVGKPIKAESIIAANEIVIETERGHFSFDSREILSVQFIK